MCSYEFDGFRFDIRRRLLYREGKVVPVKPKALETLLVLIEHRDRVVEKDELMRRLWPDTVVEEANLTQNVFVLRKALGEAPDQHRFIATFARRGYRFVAQLQEHRSGGGEVLGPPDPTEARAGVPWTWRTASKTGRGSVATLALFSVAAGLTAALARLERPAPPVSTGAIHSIAVLPFSSLSAQAEQGYFADGMTDAVISDLTAISALRVVSRQSSMRYKGSQQLLPRIARELGVDAIVEGSVARTARRVRVVVRLVEGASDRTVWSDSYDRDVGDILALQGEIARSVADAVQVTVNAQERAGLADRRAVHPEAYDLYLRGRHLWELRSEDALRKSTAYYQQAIARDPTFAQAYGGLALTQLSSGYLGYMPGSEAGPRARAAALRALALDPHLSDGHVALAGFTVIHDWDWIGGERAWKRILARNPNHPTARHWYGFLLERLGRLDEALAERRRAVEADPLSPSINTALATVLYLRKQYDEAIDAYRRTLDLDPHFRTAHVGLGLTYLKKGRMVDAIAELEAAATRSVEGRLVSAPLGYVYGRTGRLTDAGRVLEALESQSRQQYVPPLFFAWVHAGMGDRDAAFSRLEEAYEQRSPHLIGIAIDAMLEPLRDDPRFTSMLKRMRLVPSS